MACVVRASKRAAVSKVKQTVMKFNHTVQSHGIMVIVLVELLEAFAYLCM